MTDTNTSEMVKRMAQALTAELARQDGYDAPWVLEDGRLAFLDQNDVDMFALARAAIEAMREHSSAMAALIDEALR